MTEARDFWSRRKAAVEAEAEAVEAAEHAAETERAQAELAEKSDAEILAELELPDPDTLKMGDDVSGFMHEVVPARLRHRALRRLWRLNPVLANVDGLVDYGEDFTDAACVIENLQTAYQVGKGMLAHVEALAAQEEEVEPPSPDPDDVFDEPIESAATDKETAAVSEAEDVAEAAAAAEPGDEAAALGSSEERVSAPFSDQAQVELRPPAPRRMTFEFEG